MQKDRVLESSRLWFRKITFLDFADLKGLMSDPDVMYAWEHVFLDRQVNEWIQAQLDYYDRDGVGYFAVFEKSTSKFIGQMGLHRFELEGKIEFEVAYMLSPKYWRKGYAVEGVYALLDYAFAEMGLSKVYAQIKTDNAASVAVAQRTGFKKQSTFIKHYNGRDMEHFLYLKSIPTK